MGKKSRMEMPSKLRERVTEHLCGELLSYSDRAVSIAVSEGGAGTYRYESELLEMDEQTLCYNVEITISGLVYDSYEEGERGIAFQTVRYLQAVDYSVRIDGIEVSDNDTGEDYHIPEGLVSFMYKGLSGTNED